MPTLSIEDSGGRVGLRRATTDDLAFLVDLFADPEIEPFLAAVSPHSPEELQAELARSRAEPAEYGRLIATLTETPDDPIGSLAYEVANRRSRIAYLYALAISPSRAGQGLGVAVARLGIAYLMREVGYHRVQAEIYGFNNRALHVAEQAGMRQEGVRRRAYWRRGGWVDGVLFGAVADDPLLVLDGPTEPAPPRSA